MDSFKIIVPATTTNLGPGFDALGIALTLYNELEVSRMDGGETEMTVEGLGSKQIDAGPENLIRRTASSLMEEFGSIMPPLRLKSTNRVPPSRGLGSSAAARAAGLALGNELLGRPLTVEETLRRGCLLEGHPDNIFAAVLGGVVVAGMNGDVPIHQKIEMENAPVFVAIVPELAIQTETARSALPKHVLFSTAARAVNRCAHLVAALTKGDWSMLEYAMRDDLHEPHRLNLAPGLEDGIEAARGAGAWGVFLSGAGSAIMALCSEETANHAGQAATAALAERSIPAATLHLGLDRTGLRVCPAE